MVKSPEQSAPLERSLEMTVPDINEEDIREFSTRLERFAEGLSAQQQALLGILLVRAVQSGDDDVEAHAWWADPAVHFQIMHLTQIEWSFLQNHLVPIIQHAVTAHNATPMSHFGPHPQ
jgi:hypothetical protein